MDIDVPSLASSVIQFMGESKLKPFDHTMGDFKHIKFSMQYATVPTTHIIHKMVSSMAALLGYTEVNGLRLNVFHQEHYIDKHIDTAFVGCDTFVMAVMGFDRFIIEGTPAYQHQTITILHEGTPHEVIRHPMSRISLCGWLRRIDKCRPNNLK